MTILRPLRATDESGTGFTLQCEKKLSAGPKLGGEGLTMRGRQSAIVDG